MDTTAQTGAAEADRLEAELTSLAAAHHALTARLLATMAAYEATEAWAGPGIWTFGQWASINLGLSPRATTQMLATAQSLERLPQIAERLAAGELSYDKARLLAAVVPPEQQETWLHLAVEASTTQLARITAAYRRCTEQDERDEEEQRQWRVGAHVERLDRGLSRLIAVLPDDEMALVMAALDARAEQAWRETPEGERQQCPSMAARRAQALVDLADLDLANGPEVCIGGERREVVIHADEDVLCGNTDTGRCHLSDGPSISPETARRLACDAKIRPLLHARDGRPVDLGRGERTVTPTQRRLLQARDGGCVFPGCHNTRFVDAHHLIHWLDGGRTDMDNLVLLCRRHHRKHHEGGFEMTRSPEGRLQVRRDGRIVGASPPRGPDPGGPGGEEPPDPNLPRARGGGGRFDLDLTVALLTA